MTKKEAAEKKLAEETLAENFNKTGAKRIKGFRKTVYSPKKKKYVPRCQKKTGSGKQCELPIIRGRVYCKAHDTMDPGKKKSKEIVKAEQELGIFRNTSLLKKEMEVLKATPIETIMDMQRDVITSDAIIEFLLNPKPFKLKVGDTYSGKKIASKADLQKILDAREEKRVKSLQYAVERNANIKKMAQETKLSEYNVVSKDFFHYIVKAVVQLIQEEVKDDATLARIGAGLEKIYKDIAEQVKK